MTTKRAERPLRVIQWGPGAVGTEMIRAILDQPRDLELVGVKVYSESKDGEDVGTLVGRAPIGVTATTDLDELLALDADCVLYTPRLTDVDEVCSILASGKNLVTTAFLFHPDRMDAADRDRLLAACETGRASVHGSGLNPGNLSSVLPLALSGMSRSIEKVTLQERADWTMYDSTSITFDNCAFGSPVDQITPTATDYLAFQMGRRDGEPLIEIETLWTVGGEYPDHWPPKPKHGWTLTIEGDPSMRTHFMALASFTRPASIEDHVRSMNVAIGMQVLNAVPAVCDAAPGFATTATLPLIRSRTGFAPRVG